MQLTVEAEFDSTWMYLPTRKFTLESRQNRQFLAFFFIPKNENPVRKGNITFRVKETGEHVLLNIKTTNPAYIQKHPKKQYQKKSSENTTTPQNTAVIKTDKNHNTNELISKLEQNLTRLQKKVETDNLLISALKEELRKKDLRIQSLTDKFKDQVAEIDNIAFSQPDSLPPINSKVKNELAPLYDELIASLIEEIRDQDVELEWKGNKISLSIAGHISFISGSSALKMHSIRILNKIARICKKKRKSIHTVTL